MPTRIFSPEVAEAIELEYWRTSPLDNPQANSVDNILNKASEARVFLEKLNAFGSTFAGARDILELGAGQTWASCLVKRFHPSSHVTATDLSATALEGASIWHAIYGASPDAVRDCRAYELPFADSSFDLIFAFAAAHHFHRHRRSLQAIARVLRPGGKALYLHEPSCAEFIYKAAYRRVNRKRPEVPEDVLVRPRLRRLAEEAGLDIAFHFAPTGTDRDPIPGAYYLGLRALPILQKLLPCTIDVELHKPIPAASEAP